MVRIKLFLLFIIGATLGLVLALWTYNTIFVKTFEILRYNINTEWSGVELSMNRIVDQAINMEKMLIADKVKHDSAYFSTFIEIRGKFLGADTYDQRVELLDELEIKTNEMLAFYNPRYDLRAKKFSYIEWGMTTQQRILKYKDEVKKYNETVIDYNRKLKAFPFSLVADNMKLTAMPVAKESVIDAVQVAAEE